MASESDNQRGVRLRSITIENFRGIDRLALSFVTPKGQTSPIVVLAGPNGCGKTSVLEACLLAVGQRRLVHGTTGEQAIRLGAARYEITADFDDSADSPLVEPNGRRCETIRVTSDGEPVPKRSCLYFSSWRAQNLVRAMGISAGHVRVRVRVQGRGAGVQPGTTVRRLAGEDDPSAERFRLPNIKQYLINSWAHTFAATGPERPPKESEYSKAFERINALWHIFYPRSDQTFFVSSVGPKATDGFDVFLGAPGVWRLPVDDLSSGQLELFTFAGTLAMEQFDRGIVIVDELELHLDPQWHRLMLQAIRTILPGAQLIATTHSPAIYSSVLSFERHFLVPEDDPRAEIWAGRDRSGG